MNKLDMSYDHRLFVSRLEKVAVSMVGKHPGGAVRWKLFCEVTGFDYETIKNWIYKGYRPSVENGLLMAPRPQDGPALVDDRRRRMCCAHVRLLS